MQCQCLILEDVLFMGSWTATAIVQSTNILHPNNNKWELNGIFQVKGKVLIII